MASDDEQLKILSEQMNRPVTEFPDYFAIHKSLLVYLDNNVTLPDWTNEVLNSTLAKNLSILNTLISNDRDILKITSGPILNEMTENMRKSNSSDRKKFLIYSVTEDDIFNFFKALGLKTKKVPEEIEIGDALIVDLLENDGKKIVKINYNSALSFKTVKQFPLDNFLDRTKEMLVTDTSDLCKVSVASQSQLKSIPVIAISWIFIFINVFRRPTV